MEPNPLDVLDSAQNQLWELSHRIKEINEGLGEKVWYWSLQIEHAVKVLREQDGLKIVMDDR